MKILASLLAASVLLAAGAGGAEARLPGLFDGLLPELRAKLEVMVRVDPRIDKLLRDLARQIPEHLYNELVAKTNELVRQDFFEFRDGIQELIDHELMLVPCAVSRTLDGAVDTISRRLDRVPNPAKEFQERIAEAEDGFDADDPPLKYATDYVGLLKWGDDVSCAESASIKKTDATTDPLGRGAVQIEIDKARQRLQPRWLVWTNLEDSGCNNPRECVAMRHAEVHQQIEQADIRDVNRSNVRTHFASITVPPKPGKLAGFLEISMSRPTRRL